MPFPVWFCGKCRTPVVARREDLPIDPQEVGPPVYACADCGGSEFDADSDIMDTWATSSLTPEICATLLEPLGISAEEFARRNWPMTLRPNAHDIIRTWDFYTIVRSLYMRGDIPWTTVLISGHALDPAGKKISKSRLTAAEDPSGMLLKARVLVPPCCSCTAKPVGLWPLTNGPFESSRGVRKHVVVITAHRCREVRFQRDLCLNTSPKNSPASVHADFKTARSLVSPDFAFRGPFIQSEGRDAFFDGAARLAPIARGYTPLRQWQEGTDVSSVYELNLETPIGKGAVLMSEWSTVENGQLTASRVLFETAAFRALVPPRG